MVTSRTLIIFRKLLKDDGTLYAVKVARTVWFGGKVGDSFKNLPIEIIIQNNPLSIGTLVEVKELPFVAIKNGLKVFANKEAMDILNKN